MTDRPVVIRAVEVSSVRKSVACVVLSDRARTRTTPVTAKSDAREATRATIFIAKSPLFSGRAVGSVQQAIELRPDLVLLCACLMAESAIRLWLQLGGRGFRLVMIEVVVSPCQSGARVPLGILDGHVGAVEFPREIASARRFRARTVGELLGLEDPLQFFEEDRAVGE